MDVNTPIPQHTRRSGQVWNQADEGIRRTNDILKNWNYPTQISRTSTDTDFKQLSHCWLMRLGINVEVGKDDSLVRQLISSMLAILAYRGSRNNLDQRDSYLAALCWLCLSLDAAENTLTLDWSPGSQELFKSISGSSSIRKSSTSSSSLLSVEDEKMITAMTRFLDKGRSADMVKPSWEFDSTDAYKIIFLLYRVRQFSSDDTLRLKRENTLNLFLAELLSLITRNLERELSEFEDSVNERKFLENSIEEDRDRIAHAVEDIQNLRREIKETESQNTEYQRDIDEVQRELTTLKEQEEDLRKQAEAMRQHDESHSSLKLAYSETNNTIVDLKKQLAELTRTLAQLKADNDKLSKQYSEAHTHAEQRWQKDIVDCFNSVTLPSGALDKGLFLDLEPIRPSGRKPNIQFTTRNMQRFLKTMRAFGDSLKVKLEESCAKGTGLKKQIEDLKKHEQTVTQHHARKDQELRASIEHFRERLEILNEETRNKQRIYEDMSRNRYDENKLIKMKSKMEDANAAYQADLKSYALKCGELCGEVEKVHGETVSLISEWTRDKEQIDAKLQHKWDQVTGMIHSNVPTAATLSTSFTTSSSSMVEGPTSPPSSSIGPMQSVSSSVDNSPLQKDDRENCKPAQPAAAEPSKPGFMRYLKSVVSKFTDQNQFS